MPFMTTTRITREIWWRPITRRLLSYSCVGHRAESPPFTIIPVMVVGCASWKVLYENAGINDDRVKKMGILGLATSSRKIQTLISSVAKMRPFTKEMSVSLKTHKATTRLGTHRMTHLPSLCTCTVHPSRRVESGWTRTESLASLPLASIRHMAKSFNAGIHDSFHKL